MESVEVDEYANLEAPPEDLGEPSVVAVVIGWGESPGLATTLESLHAQDYSQLSVLVVDAGSTQDLAPIVAESCPDAYIKKLESVESFAQAANDVIGSVQGSSFLLFCRRGATLKSDALSTLMAEAVTSNAGVLGPKIVDQQNPDVLLEVGMAIDHYGVPFTDIEPGEIDQDQHAAVKDVFYISSTVFLVRFDLFKELGGFDPETFPGVFDLDFCWRARLHGARVLAVPDSVAYHQRSVHGAEVTQAHGADAKQVAKHRLFTVAKCYSLASLVWVLPRPACRTWSRAYRIRCCGRSSGPTTARCASA